MKNTLEQLEEVLCNLGGYAVIPSNKRAIMALSDGLDDGKVTLIKSIVSVDENCGQREPLTRLKCIDIDDEMWDIEEYLTEGQQQSLLESMK